MAAGSAGMRGLLSSPSFMRLWSIGGCVNAMRWFEVLAAALFTLDMTGSGLAVAIVSAARTMPMLLLGAFAGVMAEAVDRKRVLVVGQFVTAAASATVAILGMFGVAQPWHLATAALVAGIVWSTEMSTRRSMVGESVPPALVPRALALDTLTNSITRMIGPIIAGTLYQFGGLAGAFSLSALVYLLAALLALGLQHEQTARRFILSHVPRDLAEGISFARGHAVIAGVLMVTIAMNLLGFPYSALIAPIGRQHFMVSPALVGMMAASESFGAFLGGLWLTSGDPPGKGRVLMVGGSLLFLVCAALMPLGANILVGVRAVGRRRLRFRGLRQYANVVDHRLRTTPHAFPTDGAADRLHRRRTRRHPAGWRVGKRTGPIGRRRCDRTHGIGGRCCRRPDLAP